MKRLFSLLLLLIISIQLSNGGNNERSKLDDQVEDQIQSKYLINDLPVRYYSNILIHIQGNATKEDSLIFKQLVDTLNVMIDKWDVYLIPVGTSNLEVNITNSPSEFNPKSNILNKKENNEIVKNTITLFLPRNMDYNSRKKLIYYRLLNALVLRITKPEYKPIPGSIFTETRSDQITFNQFDFKLIKKLYSKKYDDILDKRLPPKDLDYLNNNTPNQNKNTSYSKKISYTLLTSLLIILSSFLFLIILSLRGVFKDHNYVLMPFMKQGFWVVVTLTINVGLSIFYYPISLAIKGNPYLIMLGISTVVLIVGLIFVYLVFLIERVILSGKRNFQIEIIIPMVSIAFLAAVLVLIFLLFTPSNKPLSIYLTAVSSAVSYSLFIGFGRAIFIYTRKKSEGIIRAKDVELAKMGELQKQAELQSLRAKINPHFLYNALNSIASLATTDARKTEQMALALSDFFKYAINREQKQLNSLSEELNATRTYLEIEKVRFGDRLNFEIDCEPELMDLQIPQLLIQPLVENAIKHGLSQITENGMIRIAITNEGNQLKIRVYDNGPAFPDGPLSGFGIQNTQERIVLLYGSKTTINWNNQPEKYIELRLPFVTETI